MWSSAWCGCHRGQRSSGCMNRNTVQKEGGVALSFSGCQATLSWWLLAQVPQFRGNKLRTFKEWLGGRWSQASEEQKQGTLEIIRWSVFAHAPMFVCVAGEVNMKYVCQKVCTFHLDPVSSVNIRVCFKCKIPFSSETKFLENCFEWKAAPPAGGATHLMIPILHFQPELEFLTRICYFSCFTSFLWCFSEPLWECWWLYLVLRMTFTNIGVNYLM